MVDSPRVFPQGKYAIILADPPWAWTAWSAKGMDQTPEQHYSTMTIAEIAALPVNEIALHDSALFLWATAPHLVSAGEVLAAWGFRYSTVAFTWVKLNDDGSPFLGMGYTTRSNAEFCLLGWRGKGLPVQAHDVKSLVLGRRMEHSRKPDLYGPIERLFGASQPRIELFARRRVAGWDAWGLETPDVQQDRLALEVS